MMVIMAFCEKTAAGKREYFICHAQIFDQRRMLALETARAETR